MSSSEGSSWSARRWTARASANSATDGPDAAAGSAVRHPHYLIGDGVGLALVAVARPANAQLRLHGR
jgi:hypothetical protein